MFDGRAIVSRLIRRQLTLFLPLNRRAIVEPIRQRLDPRQHAVIQAHVTLCRDDELVPWPLISQRLASLGEISITMQFAEPQVLPDGCVLLRPTHGAEQYQLLRQSILGSSAKVHGAHITLLHPRNAAGVIYNLAEIAPVLAGLTATFRPSLLLSKTAQDRRQYSRSMGPPPSDSFKPRPLYGRASHRRRATLWRDPEWREVW